MIASLSKLWLKTSFASTSRWPSRISWYTERKSTFHGRQPRVERRLPLGVPGDPRWPPRGRREGSLQPKLRQARDHQGLAMDRAAILRAGAALFATAAFVGSGS